MRFVAVAVNSPDNDHQNCRLNSLTAIKIGATPRLLIPHSASADVRRIAGAFPFARRRIAYWGARPPDLPSRLSIMISRPMLLVLMLAAAAGLPYVMSSTGHAGRTATSGHLLATSPLATPLSSEHGAASTTAAHGELAARDGANWPPAETAALASGVHSASFSKERPGSRGLDLAQVFNFDVSPAWVMNQWPRVSASLGDVDLQGYRVPMVSGVRSDDLAGSLSYYFDSQQRAVRITFQGATGDPRKIVHLVTSRFGFHREATTDPSLVVYAVKWNNEPRSELRIRTATVVRAHEGFANFDLELSLCRF